ncbi:DeoR/GlpR family DNA-binding transcription regulator [Mucilaginibacter myungsuensis]|uniref:DeoR/GlpR transcriptional regulator n=1 Tax=Mucilaginibacter myungsuensis TaxID=649104 RepID=A0A929PVX6_9SPHI|nr:DeoR/GlpR family DNA-binding transcription regulator [Mucilaginibacter myungsuensis]MBE9661579.1 DeoR/GlpR transcriptional regulator [Mucilaginibacter myungsuensis]MDN3597722.1 DeoR/GlpR family DNA-binding transcription regulator [Mucilaginibacter myungsuensis]
MINLAERHQFILNKLKKEGNLNVVELCQELKVSSVTIRKDLKVLEDKNLLFRTHGGATLTNPYIVDRPVNEKEKVQSTEKLKIAAAAAGLVEDNDSVIIASGTTMQYLAKSLPPRMGLTVITSALNVALELLKYPTVEVMQLGGLLRKSSSSVTGTYAEQILADFFCSKLFLGVDGIDLDFGLTTTNAMEAQLNRQMIKVSQKTIVLCDSTKFGRRGFGKICGLEDIDHIITDSGVSEHVVKTLEGLGITVTIV